MTIVFMGTPAFAIPSLHRLFHEGHQIPAVYTQPDRPAGRGRRPTPPPLKPAAQELGLPIRQPETLRDPNEQAELAALRPEVIVAVAYGQLVPQEVLNLPPKGVLNVHPSLLPRHRGASPIPAAILAGDDQTGVTIMLMDAGLDTGPIIAQRSLPIQPTDTTATLTDKLSRLAADLLAETLPAWLQGQIEPRPQDESKATKAPLLRKQHGAIDWTMPAVDIWRRVRAYNPWPGAYTALDGELIHIWEAWPLTGDVSQPPGTAVRLSQAQQRQLPPHAPLDAFGVQTGEGVLVILSTQRAGRRRLSAGEFLRGMPGLIRRRLGAP